MTDDFSKLVSALKACPIVPVLTIDDAQSAAPLAKALSAAGLTTAEITLRTPAALGAIRAMKDAAPDLFIGAGTILSRKDLGAALKAGSDFIVTPAVGTKLLAAIKACAKPVFPGAATPSEALELYEQGFAYVKFFPAESNGGIPALKSMAGPLPQITFMPTGGINGQSAPNYLALPNVIAVGGSWMVDKTALAAGDFKKIEASARQAVNDL